MKTIKRISKTMFLGALMLVFFAVGSYSVFAGETVTSNNSCPFSPKSGRIIVNVSDGGKIYSNKDLSRAETNSVFVNIPDGTYKVTLATWDGYSGRHNKDPRDENETWKAIFMNSGSYVTESGVSLDLRDDVDYVMRTDVVSWELSLNSVNQIKGRHGAYPSSVTSNSVLPVCVALDAVNVAEAPSVSTQSATNIDEDSATLNGFVDPNDTNDTTRWFEWRRADSSNWISTNSGNQTFAGNFSQTITGLSSNTTYYFRAVAENSVDTVYGSERLFTTSYVNTSLPNVTTGSASTGQTSATLNCYVDPNGTFDTMRWFKWGTNSSSLSNETAHISQGSAGSFSQTITNLSENTTYYYQCVAQNGNGTTQGSILSFFIPKGKEKPFVTTHSATNVDEDSATLNGYVDPKGTNDTTRWFEWKKSNSSTWNSTNSITQGTSAGNFSQTITNLDDNTTYYFRAVAENSVGRVEGNILSFFVAKQDQAPSVSTNSATNVDEDSATLNGHVDPHGTSGTTRWFEWRRSNQNTWNSTSQTNHGTGAGSFSQNISGLSDNTIYYFRAVAENNAGTIYGNEKIFTTDNESTDSPTVITQSASTGQTSATLNCYVDPNGTFDTTRRFEWGTSQSLGNNTVWLTQGTSAGEFSRTITGLSEGTTYYFRCVAENSNGKTFGNILSFFIGGGGGERPTVTTNSATNVDTHSARLNGFVDPNGGSNTTRWFEWGTTQSLGNRTNTLNQSGSASNFSQTITSLSPNTTYYFRAVANNSHGTEYGSILSFRTDQATVTTPPQAITNLATNVGQTSARLNGFALINGNLSTDGWFEWGRTQSLGNTTVTQDLGNTSANFRQSLFGLSPNTTYYFQAVVQNTNGLSRGNILSFRTNSVVIPTPTPTPTPTPVPTPTPTPEIREASITKTVDNLDSPNGTRTSVSGMVEETLRFTITAENSGDLVLENVEIKDRIPHFLEFANADEINVNNPQREVVWFIGDMSPGERVSVTLDVIITADAPLGAIIENVARIESEEVTRNSNVVDIRVVNEITETGAVAGAFFGAGGSFFPDSLLEWLILIILILIILILSRKLYGYYDESKRRKKAQAEGIH